MLVILLYWHEIEYFRFSIINEGSKLMFYREIGIYKNPSYLIGGVKE